MKLRKLAMTSVAALAVASAAHAGDAVREVEIRPAPPSVADLERVDSMTVMTRPHSWRAVDEDTLIVWATPFHPYLVELAMPSHDLRFSHAIGLSQTGNRVHAGFDRVYVGGLRYPISGIYKLTRQEAKSWGRIPS